MFDHKNVATANCLGVNNPENITGIDNINWFIVQYTASTSSAKIGDKITIYYNLVMSDDSHLIICYYHFLI
ncbi:hypothetical protein ALNOE001_01640 [Candidatus Methanobinarius endosymbioticus]|uniref:Uncharacterized protein n=1 Tax=Candidatus Methanobinarius endosymbioticus TaxID=2006182 RepID=A0A366MG69_9EURY|nr:hypothetical protein ALNOE001_01640 [Candidatus Methanobinarius endosymbioticus]